MRRTPEPISDERAAELVDIVDALTWTWARTYAATAPHWWTRKRDDPERFAILFDAIRRHGVSERFGQHYYRYLRLPGHEFKYWAMSWSLAGSFILNRAKVDP